MKFAIPLIFLALFGTKSFAAESTVFNLYLESHPAIDSDCNLFRELVLTTGESSIARLENKLDGTCEIVYPKKNKVSYAIFGPKIDSCGVHVYSGISLYPTKIEITDYRFSTCEFVVSAPIIVKEENVDGGATTLYFGYNP